MPRNQLKTSGDLLMFCSLIVYRYVCVNTYTSRVLFAGGSGAQDKACSLAEAIQEVMNEVSREINDQQQHSMIRQNSSAELTAQDDDVNTTLLL